MGSNKRRPGPPTTTRWSVPVVGVEVGEGFTTTGVEVEVGGRAGGVEVTAGGVELPLAIAFALKAANRSPGFTAKTIPC